MKKKVLLMTAIGLVLLGAVIGAALNAVFTVTDVVVNYSPVSEAGIQKSYSLQEVLEERFIGKSTTFLHLEDVSAAVAEFPCFELEEVKKDFPRTVVLTVRERRETYAFAREDGLYAVLDEHGKYLYDKEDNSNHREGENILFVGFELSVVSSEVSGEYFSEALKFVNVFLENLGDARSNIVSISLMGTENALAGSHFFRICMREGLIVDVYGPKNMPAEKALSVLEKYLALDDAQRLYGFFDIVDLMDGGFTVSEHRADVPMGI